MAIFNSSQIIDELQSRGYMDFYLITYGNDALKFWISPPTWIADSSGKMICFFSQKVDGSGQAILTVDETNGYNFWHFGNFPQGSSTNTRSFALCISGELTEYGGMLPIISGHDAN